VADCTEPTAASYQKHVRDGGTPCEGCRRARNDADRLATRRARGEGGAGDRSRMCDLWPGICRGFDARCSCTWALMAGVYQVKLRDAMCVNHGGPLAGVLVRMARWQQGVS
jgi:hypothetical protein